MLSKDEEMSDVPETEEELSAEGDFWLPFSLLKAVRSSAPETGSETEE